MWDNIANTDSIIRFIYFLKYFRWFIIVYNHIGTIFSWVNTPMKLKTQLFDNTDYIGLVHDVYESQAYNL